MPRRKKEGAGFAREIGVDARFNSPTIQKLINTIMERGKKSVARDIVYGAFDILIKKNNGDEKKALALFDKALEQIVPLIEVRPRRVGGSVYQVPVELHAKRAHSLAFRWLKNSAQARRGKTMEDRLAEEIFDAYNGRGAAFKKREEVHRMAEANRAFAHFAWN